MTRATVLIVLLTLLLSPVLDALAHRNVVDGVSPAQTVVSELYDSGCSKSNGNARDTWHAALHCVTHMSANVERITALAQVEHAVKTPFAVPKTSTDIGRSLSPPVPPPLA